jgi:threonine/homoserine/homoserine lactone efflux protein
MTIELIAPLTAVFMLGAMSPGPSLAIVLRNSLRGGRRHGVLTGIGHGFGFGIYAFLAALGMAAALAANEAMVDVLRWTGIGLLLYLAFVYVKSARSNNGDSLNETAERPPARSAFIEGTLVAVLNPKILVWMLAIYSPFIDSDMEIPVLVGIAAIGMTIDGSWYTGVALFLTSGSRGDKLRSASRKIDGAMAALMLTFAAALAFAVV